ncbi:hypothetical protein [Candidatus Macondimonas diazotrophica]|uniref:Holin n=1 Tax=Candidatus Macondimonas diazotrophica TaxID=2305248 RepID=A0A4Z0F4Y0_9GAMM|nr:hypothetical protein [Candidatus Macondimonas diazotrophica]TFZ81337.1 hypothetical protein E4680_12825 [Candidatus Macondimonas diazotrophica]
MTNQQGVRRVSDPIRQLLEAGSLKLSGVGSSVAVASGVWGWLAENHLVIASCGVFVGGFVGIAGLILHASAIRRRGRREAEEAEAARRQELRDIEYHSQRMALLKRDMEYRDET